MNKEEILNTFLLANIPEIITQEEFNDVKKAIKDLQQENQKYKEVIDKAINDLNIIIDIVRELPLGSDCWIIDRLEANKSILKEVE